jgi:hypothetical protein
MKMVSLFYERQRAEPVRPANAVNGVADEGRSRLLGIRRPMNSRSPAGLNLNRSYSADKFAFAVIPDRGGGVRPGVFRRVVEQAQRLRPDFLISIGELLDGRGNPADPEDNHRIIQEEWNDAFDEMSGLSLPIYFCPGWHDMRTPAHVEAYSLRCGASYYSWNHCGCQFIVLNCYQLFTDNDFNRLRIWRVGEPQLRWLRNLASTGTAKHTFVFIHAFYPETERAEIISCLGEHNWTLFSGSSHSYMKQYFEGRAYYQLGRAGGAEFGGTCKELGQFDHFTWVSVEEGTPQIANVLIDAVLPDNYCEAEREQIRGDEPPSAGAPGGRSR